MLVLTRKRNEGFVIGDDVEITVLSIRGNKVRIGISAPKETPIWRNELLGVAETTQEEGTIV